VKDLSAIEIKRVTKMARAKGDSGGTTDRLLEDELRPHADSLLDETDVAVVNEVMRDVLKGAEECFNDEGIPKEVLEKLKTLWIKNLDKVRANEPDVEAASETSAEADSHSRGVATISGNVGGDPANIPIQSPNFVGFAGAGIPVEVPANTGARPKTATAVQRKKKESEGRRKKQHKKGKKIRLSQVDGPHEDSSDDDDDLDNVDDDDDDDADDDDDDDDDLDKEDEENEDGGAEEEPLGSDDDISDEDPADLFDTENVVVCQYDRITRARNKWKFHLKDGIMNLNGRDYVFQKANGDAEW